MPHFFVHRRSVPGWHLSSARMRCSRPADPVPLVLVSVGWTTETCGLCVGLHWRLTSRTQRLPPELAWQMADRWRTRHLFQRIYSHPEDWTSSWTWTGRLWSRGGGTPTVFKSQVKVSSCHHSRLPALNGVYLSCFCVLRRLPHHERGRTRYCCIIWVASSELASLPCIIGGCSRLYYS